VSHLETFRSVSLSFLFQSQECFTIGVQSEDSEHLVSDEMDRSGPGLLRGRGHEPALREGSVQESQSSGEARQQEGMSRR